MDAPLAEQSRVSATEIPSVDRRLNRPALGSLLVHHGRTQVTFALREHLDELRP